MENIKRDTANKKGRPTGWPFLILLLFKAVLEGNGAVEYQMLGS